MSDLGLSIAMSGLFAQKQSIDITGQNIANASTDGYSRQRAVLETKNPWPAPSIGMYSGPGQFGTGVNVKTVSRTRDLFLDQQIRQQNSLQGEWQQRSDALSRVEAIFAEPSATGLGSVMSSFWDAWDKLSKTSDSSAARAIVAESAATLADTLRSTYGQLQTLQDNLNDEIGIKVSHVNDDLARIGDLNKQIQAVSNSGLSPNDLMDRRDALLADLSQAISVQATLQEDNTVTVIIGGRVVVNGPEVAKLQLVPDSNGNNQVGFSVGGNSSVIQWADLGGEMEGLAEARDQDVAGYMTSLDQLAATLADQLNSQHMKGYGADGETGIPFFVGSDAAVASAADWRQVSGANSFYVNPYIMENQDRIAAAGALLPDGSGKPAAGDNDNALLIYQLRDQKVDFKDASGAVISRTTATGFYNNMISKLGVDSGQAGNMLTNQQALVAQLQNKSDSISGVSLDEEMTNLIQYQNAYTAAAKLINVIDEMMTTIIGLGSTT